MSVSDIHNESSYGTTLFLVSNSNLEQYPNNNSSNFTNILGQEVKLDPKIPYELTLANLHCPAHQNTLAENDFEFSYIQYNLGKFDYNDVTEKYDLDITTSKKLFRLAPDKSFEGLFMKNEEHVLHKSNLNHSYKFGINRNNTKKNKFLRELSESLKLHKDASQNEKHCLTLYQTYLYFSIINRKGLSGNDLLFARNFIDLGFIKFKNLNHLSHEHRFYTITSLMKQAGYSQAMYNYLMESVMQISDIGQLPDLDLDSQVEFTG